MMSCIVLLGRVLEIWMEDGPLFSPEAKFRNVAGVQSMIKRAGARPRV